MLQTAKETILSIDFDETVVTTTNFPVIDGLKPNAKRYINQLYNEGFFIIINTCRTGIHQDKAEKFLIDNEINFHLINENNTDLIDYYKTNCKKISADIYLDDKNIDTLLNPDSHNWHEIYQNIHKVVGKDTYVSQLHSIKI